MKKIYNTPMAQLFVMDDEDILTTSDLQGAKDDGDINDGDNEVGVQ